MGKSTNQNLYELCYRLTCFKYVDQLDQSVFMLLVLQLVASLCFDEKGQRTFTNFVQIVPQTNFNEKF